MTGSFHHIPLIQILAGGAGIQCIAITYASAFHNNALIICMSRRRDHVSLLRCTAVALV
jgi:hypothetical protein